MSFFVLFCPFLSFFVLFCPFLSFFVLFCPFRDFPDLLRDGPGIFPIRPFSLSRPLKSAYEEQSRKGPRHNLDLSRKKWETPGSFSQVLKGAEGLATEQICSEGLWESCLDLLPDGEEASCNCSQSMVHESGETKWPKNATNARNRQPQNEGNSTVRKLGAL